MTLAMRDGVIRGMFMLGQNPAVGGHNAALVHRGLAELDWLVVRDMTETETASFWYAGRPVRDGELHPRDIRTEVFLMPASLSAEKAGSVTNTHRLLQWHEKVVSGPGHSRSETWFIYHLGRLKQLYAGSTDPKDAGLAALTWDYPTEGEEEEPSAGAVLKEMNGYTWPERRQIESFQQLKDDGRTACGGWLYCGVYPKAGDNRARARRPDGPDGPGTHLGWAWAWRANRRNMYNRASADEQGRPWSERKRLMSWDTARGEWVGPDVVDFEPKKPPDYSRIGARTPRACRRSAGLPVHHDPRWQGLAVHPIGTEGRAGASAL